MNLAIVTGASSGLGRAYALSLFRRPDPVYPFDEIWLIARNEEKLNDLKKEMLSRPHGKRTVRVLPLDLTKKKDMKAYKEALKEKEYRISYLVESAGLGYIGEMKLHTENETMSMVDLNVAALTRHLKISLPYLKASSKTVLVGSSAAFLPQPKFAVYAATKAYVDSLGMALMQELPRGRELVVLDPGPIDTPFFDTAESYGDTPWWKDAFKMKPEAVVRAARNKIGSGRCVPSLSMKAFRILTRVLPDSLILRLLFPRKL